MSFQSCVLALFILALASCSQPVVEPSVFFDELGCGSSDVSAWPSKGPLEIAVSNTSEVTTAVVMGTYADGFGREDLVSYGSEVSTRPEFIDALEIHQVAPETTNALVFDHGRGIYFMVCMPDMNTMIVLDDVTIDD